MNFEHIHEVSQVCIADCNVFHWGYCNHILYIGAVSASSSAKAPYKRSEGKGSHSLENESQQKKNGAATTVSRDRQYCTPMGVDNFYIVGGAYVATPNFVTTPTYY